MMSIHPGLIFLAGLIIILLGAELLLKGASRIAVLMGIRPIIIGLTIVSVGTSVPELAVGISAAHEGHGSLAIGNIAGTNIINILFILGLSAAIKPLPIQKLSLKLDVPVMIICSIILFLMAWDGKFNQSEGVILLLCALAYTIALIRASKKESVALKQEYAEEFSAEAILPPLDPHFSRPGLWRLAKMLLFLLGGIALTLFGAELLVDSAVSIAKTYGIKESIIGLTIVAIGTSAPELATTVVATMKDDRDVAIGNLIGSSIYNILVILGITCLASPQEIIVGNDILWVDLLLAALVAIVCYPIFKSDRLVSRKEGIAFVSTYLIYLISIIFIRA